MDDDQPRSTALTSGILTVTFAARNKKTSSVLVGDLWIDIGQRFEKKLMGFLNLSFCISISQGSADHFSVFLKRMGGDIFHFLSVSAGHENTDFRGF